MLVKTSPESLFNFAFLLHDNRAMSIEFMFVLLHHFVYVSRKIITNYYRVIISRSAFIKLFMLRAA